MSNKEIKFDVLENAELNQIEQIGIDCNMIDDEAKKRMFAISQKKYNKMSGKKNTEREGDNMEYVCGVENVSKKKSSRIVMTIGGIAATFAVVIGGMALLRSNNSEPPVTPDIIAPAATTAVSGTYSETTTTATITETVTDTTESTPDNVNDKPKADDSQAIEAAKIKALDEFVALEEPILTNIGYSLTDLNDDSTPELIVKGAYATIGEPVTYIYFFNGSEYVKSDAEFSYIVFCDDMNYVRSTGKYMINAVYEATSDNTLRFIESTPCDLGIGDSFDKFNEKYNEYEWTELEYTDYAEHNAGYLENPPVLTADIDMASLVSQGIIPAEERGYSVCFDFLDENMEANGSGCVAEPDYEISSLEKDIISKTAYYNYETEGIYGIELYDRVNDIEYSKLCVAKINYRTGEIKVLSDRSNGAASFRFVYQDSDSATE